MPTKRTAKKPTKARTRTRKAARKPQTRKKPNAAREAATKARSAASVASPVGRTEQIMFWLTPDEKAAFIAAGQRSGDIKPGRKRGLNRWILRQLNRAAVPHSGRHKSAAVGNPA